ncbi:putative TIM-barrel fold metal-dependent hydrolase [Paenibacillus amylolyticus]|uniref:TIM-barrel fold metal-dependent hydrolase n=1 Tax=Paenibacillus amylolyticus TaxID=1451 RepID=A0AAP5H6W7_PAEAM|nr:amidohydrolase family protein [Paenibacillus amylolyticus]MDR6726310.1 putative TIM-barrel fold metal-dependent hydrolase [Paenibacillus amylolyticus]
MKIIDAHVHYSNIAAFRETAETLAAIDYSEKGLLQEFNKAGVIAGVGMGVTETVPDAFPDSHALNPMLLDLSAELPKHLYTCIGINPLTLHLEGQVEAIEQSLRSEHVVGIKLYAGYYHFNVGDEIYDPIYKLASTYQMPIVIHGGLTYSDRGLLKYSHPLSMEETFLKHRNLTFMLCHLGDPWVMDTAALLEKNPNLYTDLSGWIVGDAAKVERLLQEQTYTDHFRRAIVFAEKYDRLVFGTDWPLVQLEPYIQFVKHLIPEAHWEDVFYNNALRVFPKLAHLIG